MPSRDIEDCVELLQLVWKQGSKIYAEKYPHEPEIFLTCTFRTNDEQAELYAQGRTKRGKIVTHIRENGKHNTYPAKAFDIAFKKQGKLDWSALHFKRFAKIVAELSDDVEWGGNWSKFKDLPHFQV
jgi:peptidoglycan L-alanyl-D-glutamate endopeptidase CwlK